MKCDEVAHAVRVRRVDEDAIIRKTAPHLHTTVLPADPERSAFKTEQNMIAIGLHKCQESQEC